MVNIKVEEYKIYHQKVKRLKIKTGLLIFNLTFLRKIFFFIIFKANFFLYSIFKANFSFFFVIKLWKTLQIH